MFSFLDMLFGITGMAVSDRKYSVSLRLCWRRRATPVGEEITPHLAVIGSDKEIGRSLAGLGKFPCRYNEAAMRCLWVNRLESKVPVIGSEKEW